MCSKDVSHIDKNHARTMPHVSPHTFHIPVMGTGFTVDSPLKVARYGISSVMSIGDDILIEQMRKYHCAQNKRRFVPISDGEDNYRARRVTAYLDLVDGIIASQVKKLQASEFEPGSEITRYFEMLPDSPLKNAYREMMLMRDPERRLRMQLDLRCRAVPGMADVNIMTKVDGDRYLNGEKLPPEEAVAMSALRGYALSTLRSSIVLSAGMNRRLFGYMAKFDDFFADDKGDIKKKIIIKVSDYRSALLQGKMLATRGLWVSEYRIESGLNCGGHAFASKGHLLGPIMEEFKQNRQQLVKKLHADYTKGLAGIGRPCRPTPLDVRITVQGGIGTTAEDGFLLKYFEVDGTGWGTPFLLVPEVTNVDHTHLEKLSAASDDDVYLSGNSPLGIPFWNLRTSASEDARKRRIVDGRPGSPCPKGFLSNNTEFTDVAICRASRAYQRMKLAELSKSDLPKAIVSAEREAVLAKACLCMDLTGGAMLRTGIDPEATTAVCAGPGIADFAEITSLDKMIDHIYGRLSLLVNSERPHMFIRELKLYIDYLSQEMDKASQGLISRTTKYFTEFKTNIAAGIDYYSGLAEQFGKKQRERFLTDLETLRTELEGLLPELAVAATA